MSVITINDIAAYMVGFFFGKTQLIKVRFWYWSYILQSMKHKQSLREVEHQMVLIFLFTAV
jgi:hypothetical protein